MSYRKRPTGDSNRVHRLAADLAASSEAWDFDPRMQNLKVDLRDAKSFTVYLLAHLANHWAPARGCHPLLTIAAGNVSLSFGDLTEPLDHTDIHFALIAESIVRGEGANP